MFAEERQRKIVDLLQANGAVRVKDLSAEFAVTEDSIRKDLALLEKRELLQRTYGGAVLPRKNMHRYEVKTRKPFDVDSKRKIAAKAFELLIPGMTVFLDISTSNIELAKRIIESQINVTVVSNMLEVVQQFCVGSVAKFVCTGGTLNDTKDGFDGSFCIEGISRFRYDTAFVGNVGIDVENDKVYTYAHEDGLTKGAAIAASRKVYILSQESKFSEEGNFCFCTLEEIDGIILDEPPETRTAKALNGKKIEIIV